MTGSKLRALLAGLLFFAWLGWLTFLAFNKTKPAVLSRSQLMVASHFVLAEITIDSETHKPLPMVKIVEDLRPVNGKPLTGEMQIMNLHEARLAGANEFSQGGKYLLPLTRVGDTRAFLAAPPATPRDDWPFPPTPARPWVYWWDAPGLAEQFRKLIP